MELGDLLTVIIPVYNEEANLPDCLACLSEIRHKVIVDSGSTDRTQEIAREAGCQILNFKWDGHFPKKRNWAVRNCGVSTPWVMFLDADERMTSAVKKELCETLPLTTHDCFFVTLDNWFMGRMLRHGDPMQKTAIVRYGKGEYEHIEEQSWCNLPMEMHEHIVLNNGGTIGMIAARLEHHDKRTLKSYYSKHCDYADWESNRYLAIKDWSVLTRREKIKYRLIRSKLFPLAYWFVSYVLKGGFLDGVPGFYFAINKLSYFYQIQAKIIEAQSR